MSKKSAGQSTGAWSVLREAARAAADLAYCPYSGLGVGAAAEVAHPTPRTGEPHRIVTGCNVENASFGLTLCAECGVVSAAAAGGGGRLVRISIVGIDGRPLSPCGRCRQVLYEHGGPELEVDGDDGPVRLAELLPGAFGPGDLP